LYGAALDRLTQSAEEGRRHAGWRRQRVDAFVQRWCCDDGSDWLFYSGLVRKKNVLGTMMQSFVMMALVTVVWALIGYSFAFGKGSPFFGSFQYALLEGVGMEPSGYAATIPHLTFMVYQLMFAIITPALISGAFAERMKFTGMLLFMTLWLLLVYCPMRLVWGDGGFFNASQVGSSAYDFAGGTVVHITGRLGVDLRAVPSAEGLSSDSMGRTAWC
jgi:Amt family ammonium transporter